MKTSPKHILPAQHDDTAPYPPAEQAWRVIAVLFIVTVFSQLDRQLPALLVGPIKSEFGIGDTGFSLLQGYAFAIVYTLAGLPFGRLVDRSNRRNLIIAGVIVWSAMTALAAFSQSYWQLFVSRMGVGIGEAVLAPAAYSMIADYVPPLRRGRAIGIYYLSLAIGAGASLLLGGLILRALPPAGFASFEPWRLMFLLAGTPGVLLALLLFTVREPARREAGSIASASIAAFARHLQQHRGAFVSIFGYATLTSIIGYGTAAWSPAFYARHFDINPAAAGMAAGFALMFGGLGGTLVSASLSDRWLARGVPAARFRVTFIGCLIAVPCVCVWPLVGNATASIVFLGLTFFGTTFAQSGAAAVIQDITPNAMRGQAIALFLLFTGLFGIGFGPTAVALATDHIFGSEGALAYSLVLISAPLAIGAAWLSGSGLTVYAKTRAAVQETLIDSTTAQVPREARRA